ncbi:Protein of unknown function [Gryllus bimaculatus]|nr:Protein of unknown function [Gryllus bimaculatus]
MHCFKILFVISLTCQNGRPFDVITDIRWFFAFSLKTVKHVAKHCRKLSPFFRDAQTCSEMARKAFVIIEKHVGAQEQQNGVTILKLKLLPKQANLMKTSKI